MQNFRDLFVLFLGGFRYIVLFFGEKNVDSWDLPFDHQCYESI